MSYALVPGQTATAKGAATTGSIVLTLTLPSSPTAGNSLWVEIALVSLYAGINAIIPALSSTGVTWPSTPGIDPFFNGSFRPAGYQLNTFIVPALNIGAGAGAAITVTIPTQSAAMAAATWAQEFRGAALSTPLVSASHAANAYAPGSILPTTSNQLVFAIAVDGGTGAGTPTTPGGSWTDLGAQSEAGGGAIGIMSADCVFLVETVIVAQNPTFGGTPGAQALATGMSAFPAPWIPRQATNFAQSN